MENDIYSLAGSLKEALENDSRIAALNELEALMENNEDVQKLSYLKDMAIIRYSDMLKIYKEDSEEIKPYYLAVKSAKENLQNHPLVKEYLSKYQEVKLLYNEINNILFEGLNLDLCPKSK